MPVQELPEEFLRPIGSPSNSSLSSNSSDVILINAHYVRNSRSGSVSSSTTSTQDESLEANLNVVPAINRPRNRIDNEDEEEETMYQPIKLPTEPTLEELLVREKLIKVVQTNIYPFAFLCSVKLQETVTSVWFSK